VTIDERREKPSVHVAGNRGVIRLRLEGAHRFVAVPEAPDMKSVLVEPAASVALGEMIGIIVLKCLFLRIHDFSLDLFDGIT
jgi:phage host-nuclease inhibitor protein Gam